MLNTLMDISEAETGVMRLARERVDAGALLAEPWNCSRTWRMKSAWRWRCTPPPALVVDADREPAAAARSRTSWTTR